MGTGGAHRGVLHRTATDRTWSMTGGGALLLGLATPETVFAVVAGEITAGEQRRAFGADLPGGFLAPDPALRTLAGDAEEQFGPTLAQGLIHPFGAIRGESDRLHLFLQRGSGSGGCLQSPT